MKKLLNFNRAVLASLILLGLLILFHLSILIGIVLFDFAAVDFLWGGKMKTIEQLFKYEIVSLLISALFFVMVMIKSKRLNIKKLAGAANVAMWVLFFFFSLNTVGNLMAKTSFEKWFAIVTGLLAFFMLRIALEKEANQA